MFIKRHVSALLLIASSLVITGCAHTPPPRIKTELFQKPASVAIVESPRLRWTNDLDAGMYPYAADRNAPTVDADLLVQVSPAAFWYAPGPLNNFRRSVSIGVAVFNGRTKEFLGKQDFVYSTSAFRGEYNT